MALSELQVQPFGLARDEVPPLVVFLLVLFVSHSFFAAGVDCCFGGLDVGSFGWRAIGASEELRSPH